MIRKRNNAPQLNPLAQEGAGYKTPRSYIRAATKAATHPFRASILKSLKEGDKSTVELEQVTGEARYNLYHHLNALEQVGLVGWTMKDNKTKLYHLKTPKAPEVAVIILSEDDVKGKREKFRKVIDALSEVEGEAIPNPEKITSAEICLYYTWEASDKESAK
jgi:hypothetical protein